MSIVGLPLILFKTTRGKNLSDIEFLAIKEFEGKLVHNETQTAAGAAPTDGATLTASVGKDLYVGRAGFTGTNTTTGNTARITNVELDVNGTVVETARVLIGDVGFGGDPKGKYFFQSVGHKVAPTQVIKLRVVNNPDIVIESFIEGWEEDTGTSPQIPSI